jgi:hypothetical protein
MIIRQYNPATDKDSCHRVWREVGWVDGSDKDKDMLNIHLDAASAHVAAIDDAVETLVTTMPATVRHLDHTLPMCAVTAVTTSHIARKQGLARRVTVRAIAEDAANGAAVAGLGMFEQGFYNTLGFGTQAYNNTITFDPAQLKINRRARMPQRLTLDDAAAIHQALHDRMPIHGAVNIEPVGFIESELKWAGSNLLALGYRDGPDGALTHFFMGNAKGEHGPYRIYLIAYQTWDQFMELLALIKNLGDQVRLVRMTEPPMIQMQDLLIQPFRFRQLTRKSDFANINTATAYIQLRINDMAACMAATHLPGAESVRFNLTVDDPIVQFLPDDAEWRGAGGAYIITLGPDSAAERGSDPSLPTLEASIGAFTRLWMGVKPASGLAVTDQLSGPPDLIAALDRVLRLPQPSVEWWF